MATFTTKEIDIHAFQAGIFMAEADLISPVVVEETEHPDIPQRLEDFYAAMKRHLDHWSSYASAAGIGQYSLVTGQPAGALARVDSYFRNPTGREMFEDFHNFGEQVMGPAVLETTDEQREQFKNNLVFNFLGEDFYFVGPPRLRRTVFLTRVFPGSLPPDISEFIRDIEGISQADEMMTTQGYHLFHAIDGRMMHLPFREATDYDPTKLTYFGQMRMERKRLLFYPPDENRVVDFTQAFRRTASDTGVSDGI